MKTEPVQAKDPTFNDLTKQKNFLPKSEGKKVNTKIYDLALATIPNSNFGIICGRFAAAISPKIVLDILAKGINFDFLKKKKKERERLQIEKKEEYQIKRPFHDRGTEVPIGIKNNLYCNWINAFMQFVIFVPSLRRMFNYTSKSFSCFNDFIDTYICDREEKKELSTATTREVFEFLLKRFSIELSSNQIVDFYALLQEIMKLLPSNSDDFGDLLALHPSWRREIESEDCLFDEAIKNFLKIEKARLPFELLVSYNWFIKKPFALQRKCKPSMLLFTEGSSCYYELDSFIEYRPDDFQGGGYLTYLKIDGIWYQCDDERVRQIRSNNLSIVLMRSFLFHYRKITLNEMKKKRV